MIPSLDPGEDATLVTTMRSTVAFHQLPDGVHLLALGLELSLHILRLGRGDDADHSKPSVERPGEFGVGESACFLEPLEDGRDWIRRDIDGR